jgi:hypothetical protein
VLGSSVHTVDVSHRLHLKFWEYVRVHPVIVVGLEVMVEDWSLFICGREYECHAIWTDWDGHELGSHIESFHV